MIHIEVSGLVGTVCQVPLHPHCTAQIPRNPENENQCGTVTFYKGRRACKYPRLLLNSTEIVENVIVALLSVQSKVKAARLGPVKSELN